MDCTIDGQYLRGKPSKILEESIDNAPLDLLTHRSITMSNDGLVTSVITNTQELRMSHVAILTSVAQPARLSYSEGMPIPVRTVNVAGTGIMVDVCEHDFCNNYVRSIATNPYASADCIKEIHNLNKVILCAKAVDSLLDDELWAYNKRADTLAYIGVVMKAITSGILD